LQLFFETIELNARVTIYQLLGDVPKTPLAERRTKWLIELRNSGSRGEAASEEPVQEWVRLSDATDP